MRKTTWSGFGLAAALLAALAIPPAAGRTVAAPAARVSAAKPAAPATGAQSTQQADTSKGDSQGHPRCAYPPRRATLSLMPHYGRFTHPVWVGFHGRLARGNCGLANKSIQLWNTETHRIVGYTSTNGGGYYSITVFVRSTSHFYARFPGDSTAPPAQSPVATIVIQQGHDR